MPDSEQNFRKSGVLAYRTFGHKLTTDAGLNTKVKRIAALIIRPGGFRVELL